MVSHSAPAVVDRATWVEARRTLLRQEKALTHQREELSRQRRALPWVVVDTPYTFHTEAGPRSLSELFDGRRQLMIYHFMFGPDWEQGCPSCSFWADNYDGIGVHLAQRDTTLVAASRAPLATLLAYRDRMGWSFPWVSSSDTTFNQDFDVSFTGQADPTYNYEPIADPPEELPGLSVFSRNDDGAVFHTYSCFARGLDPFNSAYQLLDLTPLGRNEDDLDWSMAWIRRHDEYDT